MLTDRQLLEKQFREVNEINRRNLGDKYVPHELPEEDTKPFTFVDLVSAVVRHYSFPPDVVWRQSFPDLMLMLRAKGEAEEGVDVREREIAQHIANLSIRDRMELERWVTEHC